MFDLTLSQALGMTAKKGTDPLTTSKLNKVSQTNMAGRHKSESLHMHTQIYLECLISKVYYKYHTDQKAFSSSLYNILFRIT